MIARFRILTEHLDEMLGCLADAGIEPLRTYERSDGVMAVEVGDINDAQGSALNANFKPEWSAGIGIVGNPLFGTKH